MKKIMLLLIGCIGFLACEEIDMTMLEDLKKELDTTKTVVVEPTPSEDVVSNPVIISPTPDVFNFIYKHDWENDPLGEYQYDQFRSDFNNGLYEWGLGNRTDVFDPKSCEIVKSNDLSNSSKYLRSNFPQGKYGASSGFCMEGELGKKYEEAYFSYNVRFKEGFDFVDGGKLLGLSGGKIVVPNPPDGSQGFVCVMMWEDVGTIQSYIYHHAQRSEYGEGGTWKNSKIPVGEWFNITIRVVMNDIGQANGIFEGFINGKLAFSSDHYVFRQIEDMGIHKIQFHSFFGGSGSQFAAKQNEYIDWDDLAVYTYKDGVDVPRGNVKSSADRVLDLPSSKAGTSSNESIPSIVSSDKTQITVNAYGVEASGVNAHYKVTVDGNLIGDTFVTTTAKDYVFDANVAIDDISKVKIEYDNDVYNESLGADRNLYIKNVKVGDKVINLEGSSITRSSGVWLDGGKMIFASNGYMIIDL